MESAVKISLDKDNQRKEDFLNETAIIIIVMSENNKTNKKDLK
jgi:hypothetical protein